MPRGGNVIALAVTRGLRFAAGFGVNLVLAAWLEPKGFGVFGFLTSAMALFLFGSNLGLPLLLGREVARHPEEADELAGRAVTAVGLLSVVTGLVMVGYVSVLDPRPYVLWSAAFASLALAFNSVGQVLGAVFLGRRTASHEVPGALVGRVVYVGATAGLLLGGAGIVGVFGAQALAGAATLVVHVVVYERQVGRLWPRLDGVVLLARRAVPFGLNALFGAVYLQADVQVLKAFHDDAEVGLYQAAALMILHLPVLAQVLNNGLYPRLSRHIGDPVAAGADLGLAMRILLVLSVPIALGGMAMPRDLMALLGEDYRGAGLALAIMMPLLPLRFLNNGVGMALSALDRQEYRTRAVFLAAVFNLLANVLVIPRWGAAGAAATTLLTELVLVLGFAYGLRGQVVGLQVLRWLSMVLLPALVMLGVVLATAALPVLVRVALGGLVYLPLAHLTRAWSVDDLRELRRI